MKHLKYIFFTVAILFAVSVSCQVVPPPVPPPPPPGLPIDSGVVFLIISGALFGAYKLRK